MNKKVKFGVIGLGHIGKKHVDAIIENKHCELVAIADKLSFNQLQKNTNRDLNYLLKYNYYTDINKVFENPEVQVVNVCTPNAFHYEMALQALNNKKHVLVEKPMTLNSHHAKSLVKNAQKQSRNLFCVMQNRFSPTILWLKEIIEMGTLGELYHVHVNCFWNRNEDYYKLSDWHGNLKLDGGPLFTQFSHFIDILYWLFGDFSNIDAEFFKFRNSDYIEFEDSGILKFNFPNGAKETLNYSTSIWEKNFESSIIVVAQKGTVKIGGQYMDKLEYCNIEKYQEPSFERDLNCNDYGSYTGSAANHSKVIENIVNVILNNDIIATNGFEGAKIVEIIEKIYSFRQKIEK